MTFLFVDAYFLPAMKAGSIFGFILFFLLLCIGLIFAAK